ncbi:MAG TPA: TIGR03435 family protein [Terriglobales bacterium]|nr:TIGR03435 family protein [Terriglobales bacterium]
MRLPFAILCLALAVLAGAQAAPPTSFDAFSIKPSPPPEGGRMRLSDQYDPTRITIENLPLRDIIQSAFELKPYQLVAPDWMGDARFNITAVTASPATQAQMNKLLQAMLTQQFKLTFHRDTKETETYALTTTDAGAKLKAPGPEGVQPAFTVQGQPSRPLPKGGLQMSLRSMGGSPAITLRGDLTMEDLASNFARQLGKQVTDETGLTGDYDINLTFAVPSGGTLFSKAAAARMAARGAGAGPDPGRGDGGNAPPEAADPAPSIFTAVQQLGLKLESKKGPVELLVIDSALKSPVGQ